MATMRQIVDVFGWLPYVDVEGRFWLAGQYESQRKTAEAVAEYRYIAEHSRDIPGKPSRSTGTMRSTHSPSCMIKRIEARFKIISLSERELGNEKAAAGYRAIVRDYGLAHQRGPSIAEALKRLGSGGELGFPPRAALLIGGGINGLTAWSHVLQPLGFVVHPRSQYVHSGANLAPYDLVILAPQGGIAFGPAEILALRSYVATGGSLLVIASPGWDYATPAILNPLLSFFDVHAGGELVVSAQSTEIVDHPITRGIASAWIKNPNHLEAPAVRADPRRRPQRPGSSTLPEGPSGGRVLCPVVHPGYRLDRYQLVGIEGRRHTDRVRSTRTACRSSTARGSKSNSSRTS